MMFWKNSYYDKSAQNVPPNKSADARATATFGFLGGDRVDPEVVKTLPKAML